MLFSESLANILTRSPREGGAGMCTRPSYYSGRGATTSDLNSDQLEAIWQGIKTCFGDEAAEAFVQLVEHMKKLGATDFLLALARLEQAGWKYTPALASAEEKGIYVEDEGSAWGTLGSVLSGGMHERDSTPAIRNPFLARRGREVACEMGYSTISNRPAKREPVSHIRTARRIRDCDGSDRAIRNQARDRREIASQTEQLPLRGSEHPAWAKMGVVFGQPVEGNDLFRKVALPAGWKVEPTDHPMWSRLLDEKGRERGTIFYKAAFYDREAHISPTRRYSAKPDYSDEWSGRRAVVCDGEKTLFATDSIPKTKNRDRNYYKRQEVLLEEAIAWLTEHYPDWQDEAAYWDVE